MAEEKLEVQAAAMAQAVASAGTARSAAPAASPAAGAAADSARVVCGYGDCGHGDCGHGVSGCAVSGHAVSGYENCHNCLHNRLHMYTWIHTHCSRSTCRRHPNHRHTSPTMHARAEIGYERTDHEVG